MGTAIHLPEIRYKLTSRRHALGYTRQQLADAAGVAPETVKKWESNQYDLRTMKLTNYMKLCEALQCDYSYLLTDQNCPTREATDIQRETRLSAIASKKVVEMGHENQYFALRGLDALLRYENGWLLDQIGMYMVSQKDSFIEASDRTKVPTHLLYAKCIETELAVLRSMIQSGNLNWPEDTSPNGDDAYIWGRR